MRKAQIVPVTAGDLNARGQAICRFGELPLYVSDLLPGERAEVEVVRRSSSYALGRVRQRTVTSPQRVVPDCAFFPRCGGCTVRHLSYEGQLQAKRQLAMHQCREAGLDVAVPLTVHPALSQRYYRARAVHACAVMDARRGTGLQTGLYRSDSQDVVAVDRCVVEPERHDQLRARLRGWATRHGVPIWTRSHPRGLRHILVRSNASGTELVAGLIGYDLEIPVEDLRAALQPLPVTGCFMLEQRDPQANTLLDGELTVLWGSRDCTENVVGCAVRSATEGFVQLHARTSGQIAAALAAAVPAQARVLEFYCGSGTFSLPLARAVQQLHGFEWQAAAVQYARANAERNGIHNARFTALDLAEAQLAPALDAACGPATDSEVVLADPPRKGLSEPLRQWLAARGPRRLLLLACEGDSGARDARFFVDRGYRLAALDLYDMFPGTLQSEWLIDLQRP